MPFAGRCVRAWACPPSWATLERSIAVRSISHVSVSEDLAASSPMSPSALRFADLAVSAANASTVSFELRSERECGGQQPLMPEDALAELPPTLVSLSMRTT